MALLNLVLGVDGFYFSGSGTIIARQMGQRIVTVVKESVKEMGI